MAGRKLIDWDSIEPLYRSGVMSLNDICNQYAADHANSQVWKTTVTHPAIIQRAKAKKWAKNLAIKVKERVQEKLLTGLVTTCNQSENELIEQATEEPVKVALGQRARTAGALDFQDKLLQELREQFQTEKENSSPSKPVDVMGKVRAFKDLVVSLKGLQDQQAEQYKLNNSDPAKKTTDIVVTVESNDD